MWFVAIVTAQATCMSFASYRSPSRVHISMQSNAGWIRGDDSGMEVNEAKVVALLEERARERKARNFNRADAIRDELLDEMGVSVWDRDKVWTVGDDAPAPRLRQVKNNFYRSAQREAA